MSYLELLPIELRKTIDMKVQCECIKGKMREMLRKELYQIECKTYPRFMQPIKAQYFGNPPINRTLTQCVLCTKFHVSGAFNKGSEKCAHVCTPCHLRGPGHII